MKTALLNDKKRGKKVKYQLLLTIATNYRTTVNSTIVVDN